MQDIIKVGNSTKIYYSQHGRDFISSDDYIDFIEVVMDKTPEYKVEVIREISDSLREKGMFTVFSSDEENGKVRVILAGKFDKAETRKFHWRPKAIRELTEVRDEIDALLNTLIISTPNADEAERIIDYIETKNAEREKKAAQRAREIIELLENYLEDDILHRFEAEGTFNI